MNAIRPRPSLHQRVSRAIREGNVTPERVRALRQVVANGPSAIDYSEYALEHVLAYYWVNYFKVRRACRASEFRPPAGECFQVIDLGAGSGPAAAAVVDFVRDDLGFPGIVRMALVEPCASQVELFTRITAPYLKERDVDMVVESLPDALLARPSLVVTSYLLSELDAPERERVLTSIADRANSSRLDLLVVDEAKTTVFDEVRKAHSWPTVIAPPRARIGLPVDLAPADTTKRYTLATMLFRSLLWRGDALPPPLAAYKSAWERHDTATIQKLFHPRCRYEIAPDRVLDGRDEIVAYWERNRIAQRDVQFVVDRWATYGSTILADWRASFRRVDLSRDLHLEGAMTLWVSHGRIDRFAEHYVKRAR